MTRRTNARIAGVALLLYIVVGIATMILSGRASGGEGTAERLASMAHHATSVRVSALLGLLTGFIAWALGAALYAITREEDSDLAMMALVCRVGEGLMGGIFIPMTFGLLFLATSEGASTTDSGAANVLASFVFTMRRWNPIIAATFFAVGSTLFSWLLLRGRMIPVVLAWLGVLASILLVVGLPLQLVGFLSGPITQRMWIPMAAFEIPLALWLIFKGARTPARQSHPATP